MSKEEKKNIKLQPGDLPIGEDEPDEVDWDTEYLDTTKYRATPEEVAAINWKALDDEPGSEPDCRCTSTSFCPGHHHLSYMITNDLHICGIIDCHMGFADAPDLIRHFFKEHTPCKNPEPCQDHPRKTMERRVSPSKTVDIEIKIKGAEDLEKLKEVAEVYADAIDRQLEGRKSYLSWLQASMIIDGVLLTAVLTYLFLRIF